MNRITLVISGAGERERGGREREEDRGCLLVNNLREEKVYGLTHHPRTKKTALFPRKLETPQLSTAKIHKLSIYTKTTPSTKNAFAFPRLL